MTEVCRSAGLVPLIQVIDDAAEDQEPAPGFRALVGGTEYVVTAVLERTAALEVPGDRWADKRTARLERLLVDPTTITWQSKPLRPGPATWRGRRPSSADSEAQRAATDERALADQALRAAGQPARARPRPQAPRRRLLSARSRSADRRHRTGLRAGPCMSSRRRSRPPDRRRGPAARRLCCRRRPMWSRRPSLTGGRHRCASSWTG